MLETYAQPASNPGVPPPAVGASTVVGSETLRQVLIVEDDPGIRMGLADLFTDIGYRPLCCADGRHAFQVLASARPAPELIILDLMLPVMDGWEFRLQQRADPRLAKVPVLAISADGSAKAAAIDADAFLHKPFGADDVQRELDGILHKRERLEHSQSLMAMGTVVASVAHELKNPLTFVMGNMDLASRATGQMSALLASLRQAELPTPVPALCQALQDGLADFDIASQEARVGLDRIVSITQDLGLLGHKPESRRDRFALQSALESAIRLTAPQIQRQATLVRDYLDDPTVLGDWARLTQVFLNLLVNAAHAVAALESRLGAITIRVRIVGESAVTDIEDNGVGIRPEMVARLFEPFFSTKPAGQGSGLGLSISREIVAAHGGTIEVTSQPGRGSRFRVTLPLARWETAD
jgi:two-component system, NtrC family, sensor kinase